ncbi:Cytidyltransferase-related [Rhodopseudomonas palustris HaA2]|uniref:Cytidyltransferase-related n=1 Tax=Rhodopseudomonas palustris (strain HaA2) TaxID=316058 RepID=Q2ITG1_RHOP2|nr:PfkB family carbohydrate kinase [Rhodopseudomonas palustris]ABD08499.1 Cytidyltransferase-related [Rhodopseudomonas palustris HaA2]
MLHPETEATLQGIRAEAGPDRAIVFVSGNFNIVHPGHLRLLKFAAECGDVLVVGVVADPGFDWMLPSDLRLEGVHAIGFVDHAFLLRDRPEDVVAALKPAVVVKGKEHEGADNPEKPVLDSYGGRLLFSSGEVAFSSLDLIRREFREFNPSSIFKPLDYPRRHRFDVADLKTVLAKFPTLKVLVIGDLIVDEYIACDPLGMSQEDPTIVVTPVLRELFVGGAGIVAGHAAGMGCKVSLLTVGGKDAMADLARERLASYDVDATILTDESRPTTCKQRFRAGNKTLLRVSHLKQHDIDVDLQDSMLATVRDKLPNIDLVVFSDFNYGCLPTKLVEAISALCRERSIPMVADSQSSSQVGDISRFRNMLLIKPTEREARLALRDFDSGLVVLVEALRQKAKAKNVILTLAAEGLLVHAAGGRGGSVLTDRLPAFNTAPKDAAGAGDSFFVCAGLALAVGTDIWRAAYLASIAAACQVGRIGNIPVTAADIIKELDA